MAKWLVTGGCGFIGSNFILHLLEERPDASVTNLDALTYAGNLANLAPVEGDGRHAFVRGDIRDRALVEELFAGGFDRVVHFAAESHVDRSIHDSTPFVTTNVQGTLNLLDGAHRFGVGTFVQVSTDEVYGSLGSEGLFSETSPIRPNSPYAASKAAADLLARSFHKTFGLPVVVTRCSNNYGPLQFPEKLIPLFVTNAMEDKPLPLYGDGLNVRDWIHVADHCAALLAVAERGTPGEVYNVGGGNERTNLEITHLILEHLGKPRSLIKPVKDRPGHDRRYAIDDAKLRRELGVAPATPFSEGMADTVRWYRENRPWWESIKTGEYLQYYERQYGGSSFGAPAT